jgi:endonuclease-3
MPRGKKGAKRKAVKAEAGDQEPYPDFARPSPIECQAARDILTKEYGAKPQGKPHSKYVLDSLVRTILSQNTTDLTSARAFAGLKARNATWEEFLVCNDEDCEESVRCGGLAEIKVARIKTILRSLKEERGELSLEYVRSWTDEEVKKELGRFKGVGPKTISCVMMFTLQRAEFPVDTHVWKIALKLGWVPKSATRETSYEHLNRRLPSDLKYELHVLLVEHGKVHKNDLGPLRVVSELSRLKMKTPPKAKGELRKSSSATKAPTPSNSGPIAHLVGSRVSVKFDDGKWYFGNVTSTDPNKGLNIIFDDGDSAWEVWPCEDGTIKLEAKPEINSAERVHGSKSNASKTKVKIETTVNVEGANKRRRKEGGMAPLVVIKKEKR